MIECQIIPNMIRLYRSILSVVPLIAERLPSGVELHTP